MDSLGGLRLGGGDHLLYDRAHSQQLVAEPSGGGWASSIHRLLDRGTAFSRPSEASSSLTTNTNNSRNVIFWLSDLFHTVSTIHIDTQCTHGIWERDFMLSEDCT